MRWVFHFEHDLFANLSVDKKTYSFQDHLLFSAGVAGGPKGECLEVLKSVFLPPEDFQGGPTPEST